MGKGGEWRVVDGDRDGGGARGGEGVCDEEGEGAVREGRGCGGDVGEGGERAVVWRRGEACERACEEGGGERGCEGGEEVDDGVGCESVELDDVWAGGSGDGIVM